MNNAWLLFKGDLKRLSRNVVTIVTVIGLIVIPSIFSWYNILACWNVFDNTGNLKVAVANTDAGYKSDLVPVEIALGEEVVSALRANDQLDWVITDEEDAIDGARSGRYYAAVVIPESFSSDMMSFYSSDVEHAQLIYYTNEKKNAIAPKVTDQGADRVSIQVNQVFTETLAVIALNVSSSLLEYADQSGAEGRIGDLANHIQRVGESMHRSADVMRTYASVLDSTRTLIGDSGKLLADAQASGGAVIDSVSLMKESADDASAAMGGAVTRLTAIANEELERASSVEVSVDTAFDRTTGITSDSAALIDDAAKMVEAAGDLERAQALREAAQKVRDSGVESQAVRDEARSLSRSAKQKLADARGDLDESLRPTLDSLTGVVYDASSSLAFASETLEGVSQELSGTSESLSVKLGSSKEKLEDAATQLDESAAQLEQLSVRLTEAVQGDDLEMVGAIIGNDPSGLASMLSSPVKLERKAVYPVENFGSAMAPLYTTLALWIGALLMMVTLKVVPSERTLSEFEHITPRQRFIGRFGVVALISLCQSTCVSIGNMLFVGVQVVHPFLYVICFWVSGLVFAFMIYTLVVLFANLGKAIGVVLLIIQVGGGGGSFPLQLLPTFFQDVSPYLPIAHAVNAMRAAMFGVYNGDFWVQIGILVLFAVPFLVLGLILNGPLGKVVPKFVEKVESTKVM
ncbi:MAG: YhgE/Pip domain-containing protein [Eggerthellaceae bacterium]|nr:YhgE/Pip domain-containing protein [Eggerthellaceae bacterium]